jgi:L-ascorbate metabolism protein UlaG (beta-lactamase superfamily)
MRWLQGPALASLAVLFLVAGGRHCALGADPNLNLLMDPNAARVDFNGDLRIDLRDFSQLAWYWQSGEMSVDVAGPQGDGLVDFRDLAVLCGHWLREAPAPVYITWLGHASVRLAWEDAVIYIDPQKLSGTPHDATLVLVTHSHGDHYAPADIAKIRGPQMELIGPADVVQAFGSGQVILPGQTIDVDGVRITGVAAYNLTKANHPKSKNWVGFIVELGGKRIYLAGDTDLTPEMKALTHIDVAFLPAGGTYTMDAAEAAEATKYLKPTLAIPYHWGQVVGTLADAQRFATLAACPVRVMTVGETLSSKDLGKDFSFIAYWKFDERQGDLARDSMGSYDGTLAGGAVWQPSGGRTGGAIQLDGVDDFISAPFVLDPSAGPFSVFAWVRGGAPGQVVLSQSGGESWLAADSAQGALQTELRQAKTGRAPGGAPLGSQALIIGDEWHRVGLTWDGSSRVLYVDNVEVARDTQASLAGATGGLNIGAGGGLAPGSFWSGLLDDVRLYSRAIQP